MDLVGRLPSIFACVAPAASRSRSYRFCTVSRWPRGGRSNHGATGSGQARHPSQIAKRRLCRFRGSSTRSAVSKDWRDTHQFELQRWRFLPRRRCVAARVPFPVFAVVVDRQVPLRVRRQRQQPEANDVRERTAARTAKSRRMRKAAALPLRRSAGAHHEPIERNVAEVPATRVRAFHRRLPETLDSPVRAFLVCAPTGSESDADVTLAQRPDRDA